MIPQIVAIALLSILLYIIYQNYPSQKECMTLKTNCDVRDRDCMIACRMSNGVFDKNCFIECQKNSPIC